VFDGELRHLTGKDPIPVVLVESPNQGAYLYADLDHDGRFGSSEEFRFQPVPERPKAIGDVALRIPMATGRFRYFPIRVRLFPNDSQPGGPANAGKRTLFYSFWAYTTGTINVGGMLVRIWCEYNPQTSVADPHNGNVGLTLDAPRKFPVSPSSEMSSAKKEAVVFRVGTKFLSIDRIDLLSGKFVLRTHSETDYQRIELRTGDVFPDFEFTDFKNHKHRLSDFVMKYILLDFWGSWCSPCIGEFPYLKVAYENFRDQGLEIIGIDSEDTLAKGKECVAEHGLRWIQATSESTSDFVQKTLRLTTYPTLILLDAHRRILSLGEGDSKLRGEDLRSTLEKLLPPRR